MLSLGKDGRLTEMPGTCHMVGTNRAGENCISAKALPARESLNKIEFNDDQAYFVMAKYVEVAPVTRLRAGNGFQAVQRTLAGYGRPPDAGTAARTLTAAPLWIRSPGHTPASTLKSSFMESEQVEGVVMIDVDRFKEVNDRFGHLVGDKALQSVAQSILSNLRQTDVLVRYGGDEFLPLVPHIRPGNM